MLEDIGDAGGSLWAAEDAQAVVRRLWLALPVAGAAMIVGAAVGWGWRDALGVAFGTALGIANFRFLHNGLKSILDLGQEKPPSGTTLMFVFRWIIVGTIAAAFFQTGWASIGGIVAGLCSPALAIGFEAVFQLVHTMTRKDGNGTQGPRGDTEK